MNIHEIKKMIETHFGDYYIICNRTDEVRVITALNDFNTNVHYKKDYDWEKNIWKFIFDNKITTYMVSIDDNVKGISLKERM